MKLKSIIYLCLEKILSPCTDKIVCISKAEKASAEREHIAKDDKLALIPNGIDVSAVRNAVAKSRSVLGIAEDAFVVGMIGRLSPQKAPDVFIRAAKLIHDEIPNSAFIIVGNVAMLLSRWEGFGLAVVEYMAAEKNVIATRIDAIPTLVDDGVDGLLVEIDNPQDAADKVLWLYRHPKEATEMKSKALKKVIENYDISRVVDQHVEMFEELAGDK